jgi:DUF3102 family protein
MTDQLAQIGDNSLADIAARIRAEHEATADALRSGIAHAMAAGDLLAEAKALVKHGEWLPWLRDHCAISERTAQLYMRCARSRKDIEANTQRFADLNLNETAALLALSSDARKLLDFAAIAEGLQGEALIDFCIAEGVGVFVDNSYNPFAGRSDAERREWLLFQMYLTYDGEAGRAGYAPQDAWRHVEYLLQRPFQNVDEWLGPEGEKWRRAYFGRQPSEEFRIGWADFREAHRDLALDDIPAAMDALHLRCEKDMAAGIARKNATKRRRSRRLEAVS